MEPRRQTSAWLSLHPREDTVEFKHRRHQRQPWKGLWAVKEKYTMTNVTWQSFLDAQDVPWREGRRAESSIHGTFFHMNSQDEWCHEKVAHIWSFLLVSLVYLLFLDQRVLTFYTSVTLWWQLIGSMGFLVIQVGCDIFRMHSIFWSKGEHRKSKTIGCILKELKRRYRYLYNELHVFLFYLLFLNIIDLKSTTASKTWCHNFLGTA